jgi:hypothetical protein
VVFVFQNGVKINQYEVILLRDDKKKVEDTEFKEISRIEI